MSPHWSLPPMPHDPGGVRLVSVELRFPPDAPPGATLVLVHTEGPRDVGASASVVLAFDEFGARGDLMLEAVTRWAEDCLRAKGWVGEGAVRAAPVSARRPETPAPDPGFGGRLG